MEPIKTVVNGLPGNVACIVAEHIKQNSQLNLLPYSLTGPEITADTHAIGDQKIQLFRPDNREKFVSAANAAHPEIIMVDYTHPSAVNTNAEFYCEYGFHFVMGTTGGDRQQLLDTVQQSNVSAVIAPNMAKQIVGFQAMMEYAANNFPNLFETYTLDITESHQSGKADTSGTAKAMVGYFNRLGIPFSEADIRKERDPKVQQSQWKIPAEYLNGHGWHTYSLLSQDKTVRFEFKHNVNGRDIYARGTLDAIFYLVKKVKEDLQGKVFTMIDVLKGK